MPVGEWTYGGSVCVGEWTCAVTVCFEEDTYVGNVCIGKWTLGDNAWVLVNGKFEVL